MKIEKIIIDEINFFNENRIVVFGIQLKKYAEGQLNCALQVDFLSFFLSFSFFFFSFFENRK